MSMIEAILSVPQGTLDAARAALAKAAPNANELRAAFLLNVTISTEWAFSWTPGRPLVPVAVADEAALDELLSALPGAQVVGTWGPNGLPWGVTELEDAEGEVIGTTGTPTHPLDEATLLAGAPPDVVINAVTRTIESSVRPTVPKQWHRWAGWRPRQYA